MCPGVPVTDVSTPGSRIIRTCAFTAPYRKHTLDNPLYVKCFEDDLLHVPPASVEAPLPPCVCCFSSGSSSTKHHVGEWFD